jgi:CBS domain-containing membrane protein
MDRGAAPSRVRAAILRADPGNPRLARRLAFDEHPGPARPAPFARIDPIPVRDPSMTRDVTRVLRWLAALLPATLRVDARERWRAIAGASLGIVATATVGRWAAGYLGATHWLAAPIGASAVLVFAVPASPLAQPWSVICGNTVSALVGIACAAAIPDVSVAAPAAVAAAIATMFALRCLHPPGGATALLVVLSHATDPRFALVPVLLDSTLLVCVGALFNPLTGRRYPHAQRVPASRAEPPGAARFTSADLDAALAHYNQVLDVSRDDLEGLLHHAEAAAYRRTLGDLRVRDVMSREPLAVAADTAIDDAWAAMRARGVKALPVTDGTRRIVGIVTQADVARQAAAARDANAAVATLATTGRADPPGPQRVGAIMTRRVSVASDGLHVIELLPLFSEGGHHHLPIVDGDGLLVGILTQSDLVRALHRAVRPD